MIELTIALGAGLISFLSPCVLPLIPGYISYISGSSLSELIEKNNVNLFPIFLFTIGFSEVFINIQGRFQQYNYLSNKEASVDSLGLILVNQPIFIRILLNELFRYMETIKRGTSPVI